MYATIVQVVGKDWSLLRELAYSLVLVTCYSKTELLRGAAWRVIGRAAWREGVEERVLNDVEDLDCRETHWYQNHQDEDYTKNDAETEFASTTLAPAWLATDIAPWTNIGLPWVESFASYHEQAYHYHQDSVEKPNDVIRANNREHSLSHSHNLVKKH